MIFDAKTQCFAGLSFVMLEQLGATVHDILVERGDVRLDYYLAGLGLDLTRSRLRQLIDNGDVLVNGAAVKPAHRVRHGDRVLVSVPPPRPSVAVPQDIPLTVVYQDADLVVIDKPAGLAAHPGPGHPDQTLVNGLLALCPDIQGIGGEIRPGIVHRLDKDTSGLMIAAKTEAAHHGLSQQIKDRLVHKGYLALVEGTPSPDSGVIDAPIGRDPRRRTRMAVTAGGRESRTGYRLLEQARRYSSAGTAIAHRTHPPGPGPPRLARPPHLRRCGLRQTQLSSSPATSSMPTAWPSPTQSLWRDRWSSAPPCPLT